VFTRCMEESEQILSIEELAILVQRRRARGASGDHGGKRTERPSCVESKKKKIRIVHGRQKKHNSRWRGVKKDEFCTGEGIPNGSPQKLK